MNFRVLIIALVSLFIWEEVCAQTPPVLGGYLEYRNMALGQWNFEFKAHFLFGADVVPPPIDSVLFTQMGSSYPMISMNTEIQCDSTMHVTYTSGPTNEFGFGGAFVGHKVILRGFKYAGQNIPDSLPVQIGAQPYAGKWTNRSYPYYLNAVYHNPKEELLVNFELEQLLPDSFRYSELGPFLPPNPNELKVPVDIRLNRVTGNLLWKKPIPYGEYTDELLVASYYIDIDFPQLPKRIFQDQTPFFYTVIVDSAIKSRFYFDSSYRDTAGYVSLIAKRGDSLRFKFIYYDPDADGIVPEWHSTLTRFGIPKPTIHYEQKGDSLRVEVIQFVDDSLLAYLPGFHGFRFTSSRAGRKCINRFFSFLVNKEAGYEGIEETDALKQITHYPNPASNSIYLSLANYRGSSLKQALLFDATGRQVAQYSLSVIQSQVQEIPLDNLQQGLFMLEIINQVGETSVFKFRKE